MPTDPAGRQRRGNDPAGSGRQPAARRRRGTDPARQTAFELLRAVAEGAYANLALPPLLRRARLEGRDAAFATELGYGATRLRGRYDPIIAACAGRPLDQIDPAVLDTLRLGAHQLLGMRVPAHAATAETVGLARAVHGAGAAGFVNAVLRRIGEHSLDEWLDQVVPADPTARRVVAHSHPAWIVTALRAALVGQGPDAPAGTTPPAAVDAELDALLAADNEPALVTLVARPGLVATDDLVADGARPGRWAATAAVLPHGDPGRLPAVRDGRAAVQDEGSQLVTLALARVPLAGPGGPGADVAGPAGGEPGQRPRWLDLCAGPGGKAGLLAALALPQGADLVANEVSEHRAELVRRTVDAVARLATEQGGRLEVRVGDGRTIGEDEPAGYDRVLVDAPCTGLGALRRRPEARWRRQAADVPVLAQLQRELLASALDAVRPGGVVGYVTCSPVLAETRFVVSDVTKRRPDVEVLDAREFLLDADGNRVPDVGPGPFVQLWPHRHGTDAMFLALLRRKPDEHAESG